MKQSDKQYRENQYKIIQRLKQEIKDLKDLNIDLQLELHRIRNL